MTKCIVENFRSQTLEEKIEEHIWNIGEQKKLIESTLGRWYESVSYPDNQDRSDKLKNKWLGFKESLFRYEVELDRMLEMRSNNEPFPSYYVEEIYSERKY